MIKFDFYKIKNVRLNKLITTNSIDDSRRNKLFNLNDNVGQTFSKYIMDIRNFSEIKFINNTKNNNKTEYCNNLNNFNKSLIPFENRYKLILYKKPDVMLIPYSRWFYELNTKLDIGLKGPYGDMGYLTIDLVQKYFKLSPVKNINKIIDIEIKELIDYTNLILKQLKTIIEGGYLNNQDLRTYPLIKDITPFFTNFEVYYNGIFGYQTFKWMFNLINLSLYINIIEYESYIKTKDLKIKTITEESYNELILLRKVIYQKLDPSIRRYIMKRGITIIQNLETGFDSEYVNKSLKTNKTISFQLAQVIQMYIKIPLKTEYKLNTINPLTEEEYKVKLTKGFNFDLLESIISNQVTYIRKILYDSLDTILNKLTSYIKQDTKISYNEDKENMIIRLNESKERTLIRVINEKGYSLEKLLEDSNQLSQKEIKQRRIILTEVIKNLIKSLNSEDEINPKPITELLEIKGFMESSPRSPLFNEVLDTENTFNKSKSYIEIKKEELKKKENEYIYNTEYHENNENSLNSENSERYENYTTLTKKELKSLSRNYLNITRNLRLSITFVYNNIFIGHNNSADLSLLTDFELFKSNLDIVNKGMITLGKGFRYGNYNVIFRDTMLLAPAGQKSLSSIGKLYNFDKIILSEYEITHMDELLRQDRNKFFKYAIRDSQITLKHAIWMESFNFQLRGIGIPTTLSNIGNKYVKNFWYDKGYLGYQLDVAPDFLIGEASKMQTPLGLSKFGELGLKIGMYISNYKGGRNESFMYGVDLITRWYDYDLSSAYTTILSNAGHPDYHNGLSISIEKLKTKNFEKLINSYIIIKCNFRFPKDTKYPSIPVYVDETTTVYPLEGTEAILTGAEYYLAQSQKCYIQILEVFFIPFYINSHNNNEIIYPFKEIINEIQSKRREFPKGTISNLMYKEIGNSIYGSVVRGMSDKRKYDNKTGQTIRLGAHFLTNPLIASWLTGFIRSVIGECLHNIQLLKGTAVSVTTDGFITNIPDLENEILSNELCSKSNELLKYFRNLRQELSGIETSLELKEETLGVITWATRGQLGITSNLRATTGFQNKNYSQYQLVELLGSKLNIYNSDKTIEFLQTSLRSAVEISKQGGHVTMKYEDRKFSLLFDNRREILDKPLVEKLLKNINELKVSEYYNLNEKLLKDFKYNILVKSKDSYSDLFKHSPNLFSENDIDLNKVFILLDSLPLKDAPTCFNLRSIANKFRVNEYNQRTNTLIERKYKNYTDLAIRNFIKGLLSVPPLYPDIAREFLNYNELINFIKVFNPKYKISKSSLSHLKNRKVIKHQIPKTDESILFIKYVKNKFPDFDDSLFFRS